MNHDFFYNLSGIEAVWVVVALVGLVLTSYNCYHAWHDYRFIKQHNVRNGRRIVGWTAATTEVTRVFVQLVFLGIGIGAGTIPDASAGADVPNNVRVVQFLVRWGLILASALIALQSYWLRRMRNKINHPGG